MKSSAAPLLDLIERRFALRLSSGNVEHLRMIHELYTEKRRLLRWEHGEAGALVCADYAKAVLISEAARLMLREISPHRKRGEHLNE